MIEAVTYRMGGHSTSDDPRRYRSDSELDRLRALDPVERLRLLLIGQGWADEHYFTGVAEEADDLAAEARRACLALQAPELPELWRHVLAEETPLSRVLLSTSSARSARWRPSGKARRMRLRDGMSISTNSSLTSAACADDQGNLGVELRFCCTDLITVVCLQTILVSWWG